MTFNNTIVIIPARKNSKRVKGKNLRNLNGKPLIAHTIEYAIKYINPKSIWVNSDDQLVLDLAKKYKVSTYKRHSKLAKDETLTEEVVFDFCQHLVKKEIHFEYIITLQPTNPLRSNQLLEKALVQLKKSKRKSLMSVSRLHKKFGKIVENKYLPINYEIGQRHQDLDNLFFENGLIYISTKETIIDEKKYISSDVYPLITDEIGSNVDIDYEDDFKLAEFIIKRQKNNENSR